VQESSFWEKLNSSSAQDGYYVVNKTECPEYANYRPWSSGNVEKELIRTVPAYEREGPGEKASNPALKWRYTSKYASTDGTGHYVMVRDDRIAGGEGNWVFVPRSCLPTTLPTSEGEHLPPAPSVTTEAASGLTTTSATLNGKINPHGVDTKYTFEYGTTESYGSSIPVPAVDAGAGASSVAVSAVVTGLASAATYYFRLVASSAIGESEGSPRSFLTQSAPPIVATEPASGVQPTEATLNAKVDPTGSDTHYYFQYGTTTVYGNDSPTPPGNDAGLGRSEVTVSSVVTGLVPGTTYHFRIVATNSAGTSPGKDGTFRTSGSQPIGDYNGAGQTDRAVWRPSNGSWYVALSGWPNNAFGESGDIPVPGAYNNDSGMTEEAVWQPSTGTWSIAGHESQKWGQPGDIPVPGNYSGEGHADVAVWRPSNGTWYVSAPGWTSNAFGESGDVPVPGAYYNDSGITEEAVWRPSNGTWYIAGHEPQEFGEPGDIPVPADYTGEGHADVAVWRPSNGTLYVSAPGWTPHTWGQPGDIPVPGDYEGDGTAAWAVWRPSNGTWYVDIPSWSASAFGQSGDIPAVAPFNRILLKELGLPE
jgi:hypothetical protein